jgi:hypothetical protein
MYWIIFIAIAIILLFIFIKIFKKVFKAFLVVGLIVIVFLAVSGFLVYNDVNQTSEDIQNKPLMILVHNEGNLLTGLSAQLMNDQFILFDDFKISAIKTFFLNKDYDLILDNHLRIFIIDLEVFKQYIPETLEIGGQGISFSNVEVISLLESNDASKDLKEIIQKKNPNLPQASLPSEIYNEGQRINLNDDSQIKATLIAASLADSGLGKDVNLMSLFIKPLKEWQMEIYPETITLKIIKDLPSAIYEGLIPSQI